MLIEPRSVQQVATLPLIPVGTDIEVLLISSRRRKRWVVPKGWPGKHGSFADAAAAEAYEEAGLSGSMHPQPIGSYLYRKRMEAGYDVPCHVFVYPMLVVEQAVDWPERRERRLKWCSLAEAASLVDDERLGRLLAELADEGGARLLDVVAQAQSLPATTAADA